MTISAGKTTPGLLKGVTWCSAVLIVAGLGLLVWSQFAGDGWISIGVASLVVLSLGGAVSSVGGCLAFGCGSFSGRWRTEMRCVKKFSRRLVVATVIGGLVIEYDV